MIHAARYLGVAPWELMRQASWWVEWAFVCENAETEAKNHLIEKAQEELGD